MKPNRVRSIDTGMVEEFIKRRLTQPGRGGKVASLATVNRELRYLRHALRRAKRWRIIDDVPEFDFEREPERIPTFVPPEHFAAIYAACSHAKRPRRIPNVETADWWRALVVFAYMTGWRIGQILALGWADVDLKAKTALSRANDNKGKRDCLIPLHDAVVEHLKRIEGGRLVCARRLACSRGTQTGARYGTNSVRSRKGRSWPTASRCRGAARAATATASMTYGGASRLRTRQGWTCSSYRPSCSTKACQRRSCTSTWRTG